MRPLLLSLFCLGLASCAHSQPQARPQTAKIPLRTLIVSGGPRPDYNQYAIESNARYLEKITAPARSQRILFADGSNRSRTISALEARPDGAARAVFAYLFGTPDNSQRETLRASTLGHIDGPATQVSVLQSVQKLASEMKPGERGLLYFTGHGSPGEKPGGGLFGGQPQDDFEDTTYALWNEATLSTRQLSATLANWPAKVPLVLVMVQCHAGGFANLIFEGGDPKKPLWNRDFCGFFAATGDRAASGCTSEVDEADYEDFTTHFFAALSGTSRDGQVVKGADYDHNGAVSPLEAFAYTNLQDGSIDVPVCTSDAYLRSIFPSRGETTWLQTPYSQLVAGAAPWQKALLDGLSKSLNLSGETRIAGAMTAHDRVARRVNGETNSSGDAAEKPEITRRFDALERDLKAKFPGLLASHRSKEFGRAKVAALSYLQTRAADVEALGRAVSAATAAQNADETREAMLWRFVRAARTLVLQKQLQEQGSAAQKAVFARLRTSESRPVL